MVLKKKRQKARVLYRPVAFNNTNRFTRADDWHIGLSKTGFINEAGHCLVMQAQVANRDVIIVLLDAQGTSRRAGDAARIKAWLNPARRVTSKTATPPPRAPDPLAGGLAARLRFVPCPPSSRSSCC